MSSRYKLKANLHYQNVYTHKTCQNGDITQVVPNYEFK